MNRHQYRKTIVTTRNALDRVSPLVRPLVEDALASGDVGALRRAHLALRREGNHLRVGASPAQRAAEAAATCLSLLVGARTGRVFNADTRLGAARQVLFG